MKQLKLYESGFVRRSPPPPTNQQQPGDPPLPQLPEPANLMPPPTLPASPTKTPTRPTQPKPTSPPKSPLGAANYAAEEITNHQPPWDPDDMEQQYDPANVDLYDPGSIGFAASSDNEPPVDVELEDENEENENGPPPKKRRKALEEITEPVKKRKQKYGSADLVKRGPKRKRKQRSESPQPPAQPPPIDKEHEDPTYWGDVENYAEHFLDDPEMTILLDEYWPRIRTHTIPPVHDDDRSQIYNLRVDDQKLPIKTLLQRIHQFNQTGYHINIQFAFILVNKHDGRLRYFYGAENTRAFPRDLLVYSRNSLRRLIDRVENYDPSQKAFEDRPNTEWILRQITNAIITVYPLPRVTAGMCNHSHLPGYLKLNHGLYNFIRDQHQNEINDRRCFFRCVAMHTFLRDNPRYKGSFNRHDPKAWRRFNLLVQHHFDRFQRFLIDKGINVNLYGMPEHLLSEAEECFGFPIYVYEYKPYINEPRDRKKERRAAEGEEEDEEDDEANEEARVRRAELEKEAIKKKRFAATIYRRPDFGPDVNTEQAEAMAMHMNIWQNKSKTHAHFSYIHNLSTYSKCYICERCNRPFHRHELVKKHESHCKGARVLNYYPGYGFAPKPTLFDRLEKKFGIIVPEAKRYHPYYAAYDWECMFKNRALNNLQQMEFEDHLDLPDAEDPQTKPAGLHVHVDANWSLVHSRTGPRNEYTVIRSPHRSRVGDYMKAFAKLQRRRFRMTVKVLHYCNRMNTTHIAKSDWITTPQQLTDYVAVVDQKLERFHTQYHRRIQAVRIEVERSQQEVTADLIPASVAIATNVPGFEDPATGEPLAHFILSDGNVEQIIEKFVRCLTKMAQKSARLMRKRFARILRRLDRLWHERYLREIYGLLRDYCNETIPLLRAEIADHETELEAMDPRDDDYEVTQHTVEIQYRHLAEMEQVLPYVMDLLEPISIRTVDERMMFNYRPRASGYWDTSMSARRLDLPPDIKAVFKRWYNELKDKGRINRYKEALKHMGEIKVMFKDIESYCTTLTTFGFNSAKFDVGLIRNWLLPKLHIRQRDPLYRRRRRPRLNLDPSYVDWRLKPKRAQLSIIKRGNSYLSIQSNRLRFLDLTNFIAPGTSYEKWLASRNVNAGDKFHFPYEWFTSLDLLDDPLPPQAAFYSSLKRRGISDDDYAKVRAKWTEMGWRNMRDLLEYYNKQDVVPFLAGIESMRRFFMEQCRIDMIGGSNISLPGIAEQRIYATVPDHTVFVLPQKTRCTDNSDLATMIQNGIVGGPAITFRRFAKVGETKIRDPQNGKLCQTILGYDANSLYLWATKQAMACQLPRRWDRQEDGSFKGSPFYRNCMSEISWIEWESFVRGVKIYHRFNGGVELFGTARRQRPSNKLKPEESARKDLKVAGVSVDGYDPENRTCYFFDGCKWHYHIRRIRDPTDRRFGRRDYGNPCPLYTEDRTDKDEVDKARYRHRTDWACRDHLRREGYEVVVMTECDWHSYTRRLNPTAQAYLDYRRQFDDSYAAVECRANSEMPLEPFLDRYFHLPHPKPIRDDREMLQLIDAELFFGIVEVDIEVPEHLREKFAELTPIFKNVEINVKDIGPHMQDYVARHNLENQFPRRSLIGSYYAHRIPLITPLLKWYMDHKLRVTKIHKAFQYKPIAAFADFGRAIEESRRKSDADPNWAPSGEMDKLIGNAPYGKSLTDLLRHLSLSVLEHEKANEKARDPFFKAREDLEYDLDEMSMCKERIINQLNTLFGFFVYNYAKMKMLSFYYDFLAKYIKPEDFELILMDTDSFYLALSGPNLDSVIRDDLRAEYEAVRNQFLPRRDGPGAAHDKRVPGLFKVEFEGTAIVAPNPKTYFAIGPKDKWSHKGIPKTQNRLTYEDYKRVLDTGRSHFGLVAGFNWKREHGRAGKLIRLDCERVGISYLFIKRIVNDDGLTTKPILL